MVRRVVDARVRARDDPYAHLVHRLKMLADPDAGQLRNVRGVHAGCRADEDAALRDLRGEGLAE